MPDAGLFWLNWPPGFQLKAGPLGGGRPEGGDPVPGGLGHSAQPM